MSRTEYLCIGKGFCGSVWGNDTVDKFAMKREDGGLGRSLRNDWEMHSIISNSLKSVISQNRLVASCQSHTHLYLLRMTNGGLNEPGHTWTYRYRYYIDTDMPTYD
jgi:hypothetical protein